MNNEARHELQRRELTEEQRELFIDASTLAYMAIKYSDLWKQLSGPEWDKLADDLGEKMVDHLNGLINVELTRREAEAREMDAWLSK